MSASLAKSSKSPKIKQRKYLNDDGSISICEIPVIKKTQIISIKPIIAIPIVDEPIIVEPIIVEPIIVEPIIVEPIIAEPIIEQFEPSSVIIVKHYKIDFYKNISEKGGAMACAIKNAMKDDIIIHIQKQNKGRLWGSCQPKHILKLLESNKGLYEVISSFPHKVYFDIDEKSVDNFDEWLCQVKIIINEYFPDGDMSISGSKTEHKTSLHVLLNNYMIHNETEREQMKQLVKYISETQMKSFDWKVYTKNRNMKCINQSKDDGRVQEIMENKDFKKHIITSFFNKSCFQFPTLPEPVETAVLVEKSNSTFNLGELPKMVLSVPKHIDYDNLKPTDVLSLLPLNKDFDHKYTHTIARYCYYNQITFDSFLTWLRNKHDNMTSDIISKWTIHWSKLDKFPPVSESKIKIILCYYYPHLKKDIHYRNFVETFNLPDINKVAIETIDQNCYNGTEKYSIFNVGMGGGKTAQTITYLKSCGDFLWVSPNKSLANNTIQRFKESDIDIYDYLKDNSKKKQSGSLNEQHKLMIVLNSLHYLTERNYEVIVIDEIETLLDKFLGDFMEQGKKQLKLQIWDTFKRILLTAKKVILLDAFITTKTIQTITSIDTNAEFKIYHRIVEPSTRTVVFKNDFAETTLDIVNKIKDGKKVFIFYPYKNQSSNFQSMDSFFSMIKLSTGQDGVYYNADVDDSTKLELRDVNKAWADKRFIITNNVITCGVNYELLDFDYTYIIIASHNVPRDMIQVSYRTRYLSSGIIYIAYIDKKLKQPTAWENDYSRMGCPLYKKLYDAILVEKMAPMKRAIQLFCSKANYKQTTKKVIIERALEQDIDDLFSKDDSVRYCYGSIETIDFSVAEILEQKCMSQIATMYEKLMLKRYYFDKQFITESHSILTDKDLYWNCEHMTEELFEATNNETYIQYIWDASFFFFVNRMKTILLTDNSVFHNIAVFNKMSQLFPSKDGLKSIKLSSTIVDRIFDEFKFKFVNKKSPVISILKNIYNTYFGKDLVKSFPDNNKNIHYITDVASNVLYEFCKKFLILDNETKITYNDLLTDNDVAIKI